jgi:hypothetical protein
MSSARSLISVGEVEGACQDYTGMVSYSIVFWVETAVYPFLLPAPYILIDFH